MKFKGVCSEKRYVYVRVCLVSILFLMWLSMGQGLSATPSGWYQVNKDGFGSLGPTSQGTTELFVFDGSLFAHSSGELFRMIIVPLLGGQSCVEWNYITSASGPVASLGGYLYGQDSSGALWWTQQGVSTGSINWNQVTSTGLPAGVSPMPVAVFNGQVYGVYDAGQSFEIWRSPDIGKTVMNWKKVVANSFGDPQNNQDIDFMGVFNGKIYAGTHTLKGMFGNPQSYISGGVEIWESATGNLGSWMQINIDGFGTETMVPSLGKKIRTNQAIGSWAVYQGYLYIGTKNHFGAEIWRYDGKGKSGWTNVTPPWGGLGLVIGNANWKALRFESMTVFQSSLYVAEGFPSGRLAKYDGTNWSVVVVGPSPFSSENRGLGSLAVLDTRLYVSTSKHGSAKWGDQVWGYPFTQHPGSCVPLSLPDLRVLPPVIRWPGSDHLIELSAWLRNVGGMPIEKDYLIAFYLDDELVHLEPGPLLAPDEEADILFTYDISDGEHTMMIVADIENHVNESDEENNVFSFRFTVPAEEPPGRELNGLSIAAEAIPICQRGLSHELNIRWATGGERFRSLVLDLLFPDGSREEMDLPEPEGGMTLNVNFPAGGMVHITLCATLPGSTSTFSTSVSLTPCPGG